MQTPTETYRKALAINTDPGNYGTLAEIGAGQETSRWFFKVGGAAGTIAKTMSAYDMKFSDTIYGECKRYVSRDRLNSMLNKEFELLLYRLGEERGASCAFFAFANTVATFSHTQQKAGHGWIGIQFQHVPGAPPSQIDMHVSLKGRSAAEDQETLGILGINLVYAAIYLHDEPEQMLDTLMDDIDMSLLELDMIDFIGPVFGGIDNRLMALSLVQRGYTQATLFGADGKLVQPAEALYKKAILVERGRFRPPTWRNVRLLDHAYDAFCQQNSVDSDEIIVISEMTLENLDDGEGIDVGDFLQRVDILCALGKNVMVSNHAEFYRLAQYLFHMTDRPVAITMVAQTLHKIFDTRYYEHLDGGILEAFGKLFRNDMRLYVAPEINDAGGATTLDSFEVDASQMHLYRYLLENDYICNVEEIGSAYIKIEAEDVLACIRSDEDWRSMVPPEVAEIIEERGLFGFGGEQVAAI